MMAIFAGVACQQACLGRRFRASSKVLCQPGIRRMDSCQLLSRNWEHDDGHALPKHLGCVRTWLRAKEKNGAKTAKARAESYCKCSMAKTPHPAVARQDGPAMRRLSVSVPLQPVSALPVMSCMCSSWTAGNLCQSVQSSPAQPSPACGVLYAVRAHVAPLFLSCPRHCPGERAPQSGNAHLSGMGCPRAAGERSDLLATAHWGPPSPSLSPRGFSVPACPFWVQSRGSTCCTFCLCGCLLCVHSDDVGAARAFPAHACSLCLLSPIPFGCAFPPVGRQSRLAQEPPLPFLAFPFLTPPAEEPIPRPNLSHYICLWLNTLQTMIKMHARYACSVYRCTSGAHVVAWHAHATEDKQDKVDCTRRQGGKVAKAWPGQGNVTGLGNQQPLSQLRPACRTAQCT